MARPDINIQVRLDPQFDDLITASLHLAAAMAAIPDDPERAKLELRDMAVVIRRMVTRKREADAPPADPLPQPVEVRPLPKAPTARDNGYDLY